MSISTSEIGDKSLSDRKHQSDICSQPTDPLLERVAAILNDHGKKCFDPRRGKYVVFEFPEDELSNDFLNRIKTWMKRRLRRYYPLAISFLSPVYARQFIKTHLREYPPDKFITINLGAGTHSYEGVIAVDGTAYDNVHLVCNLESLPIQSNSIDSIISVAVLEHVPNPEVHVSEFNRVLKPGGRVVCFVPFMQPFHASPYDFQRYTESGLKELFKEFTVESVKVGAGPTSALLWVLQEWIAITLSFGSTRLYKLLLPLTWVLSPLKLLDFFLERHPAAPVVASGFVIYGVKKEATS